LARDARTEVPTSFFQHPTKDRWLLVAVILAVGLILSPVLIGFAPLRGDPELMYLPIKSELARGLSAGGLPYWSDRFGVGVPLVAESHVAAFYPFNWFFYRVWDVATAYRLSFWVHSLGLVAATFAYARTLGIGCGGSALAAMTFTLCGFQAIHAVHEPLYHAMPYLPLCLLLAERYAGTGQIHWMAGLALAWGAQLVLGHFQIQMWTGGLVLAIGSWRVVKPVDGSAPKLRRIIGLGAAIAWGASIAWIQLRLTWELTTVAGFVRPAHLLAGFSLPPAHWAAFALPEVFLATSPDDVSGYWARRGTTPGEACAYVGVLPFLLAFVGMLAAPRDRALTPWRLIVPLSLALATMPGWWYDAYLVLLELPGFGWFRAPARYTLLTSLGLALLAGRGLDRQIASRRFWAGLLLAIVVGLVAWGWSIHWALRSGFGADFGADTMTLRFATAGLAWIVGTAIIVGWRVRWLSSWAPVGICMLELACLLCFGPVKWIWTIRLPDASPVMQQLAALHGQGLVAGRLHNLPVGAGLATACPVLGIAPPPPNYLLGSATRPPEQNNEWDRRWQRRLGVVYGVWGSQDDVQGTDLLAEIADPALDRVMRGASIMERGGLGPWKLVTVRNPYPSAWVARHILEMPSWARLYSELTDGDGSSEAVILSEDLPSSLPEPLARFASIKGWDGNSAIVEHDGSCILILRRAFYPGWVYRINDGQERPVIKVNGGLQGVPLTGSGGSRVTLSYRPTGLTKAAAVSLAALAAVFSVCGFATVKAMRHGSAARPVGNGTLGESERRGETSRR
jgi:hypothetical protein